MILFGSSPPPPPVQSSTSDRGLAAPKKSARDLAALVVLEERGCPCNRYGTKLSEPYLDDPGSVLNAYRIKILMQYALLNAEIGRGLRKISRFSGCLKSVHFVTSLLTWPQHSKRTKKIKRSRFRPSKHPRQAGTQVKPARSEAGQRKPIREMSK
jgi:hypothetical protein